MVTVFGKRQGRFMEDVHAPGLVGGAAVEQRLGDSGNSWHGFSLAERCDDTGGRVTCLVRAPRRSQCYRQVGSRNSPTINYLPGALDKLEGSRPLYLPLGRIGWRLYRPSRAARLVGGGADESQNH